MMEGPELDDDNGPLRSSHDGLFFICMELAPAYADFIEGAVSIGCTIDMRIFHQG
jgi:hypothetical protein